MRSAGQTIQPFASGLVGSTVFPILPLSLSPISDSFLLNNPNYVSARTQIGDHLNPIRYVPWFLPDNLTFVPNFSISDLTMPPGAFCSGVGSNGPGSIGAPPASLPPGSSMPPSPKNIQKYLERTSTPQGEISLLKQAIKGTQEGREWMDMVRMGRAGHFTYKELGERPLVHALDAMTKGVLEPRPDNFTSQQRTPWGGHRIVHEIKAELSLDKKQKLVGESWEISGHQSYPNRFALKYEGYDVEVTINVLEEMFSDNMYGPFGIEHHGTHMPFLVKLLNSGSWVPYFDHVTKLLNELDKHPNSASWRKSLGVEESLREILDRNYHQIHQGITKLKNIACRDLLRKSDSHPKAKDWHRDLKVRSLLDIMEKGSDEIRQGISELIRMQNADGYVKVANVLKVILQLHKTHRRMLTKNLSVQVHPTSSYGALGSGEHSKTEAWIIEDAEKGAGIYLGLKDGVKKDQFREALRAGKDVTDFLNFVEVAAGDVFYIPAGTMHAIGAGVLLVEPQETSETTYRVYDYGRVDEDGKPRELNIDSAIAVTNWDGNRDQKVFRRAPRQIIMAKAKDRAKVECLIRESAFEARRLTFKKNQQYEGTSERGIQGFTVLEGGVTVYVDDKSLGNFSKGQSFIIPASMGSFRIKGATKKSRLISTSTTLPYGIGISKPTASVSATIESQPLEVQAQNSAFVKSGRPHVLLINTQGYAGPMVPMGSTDSGGQLTYIAKKSEELTKLGYKVTIVTRAFTHEDVEEEDEKGVEKKITRFEYDAEAFGERKGVAFADDFIRYVFVPGMVPEDAPFLPKEYLYSDLPTIARNLALFIEDEATAQGKDPWNYFRFIDSHYVDAGIVGGRLVRIWQHELSQRHLRNNFGAVLGDDFKMDAFDDNNLMGNLNYHFGRCVIQAWKASNGNHGGSSLFDDPSVNEEAVLLWAAKKLGWSNGRVKRLTAHLPSSDKNGSLYIQDKARDIGYRLLGVGGDREELQRQFNAINRHVWTPHSLGRLKEQRVLDAGDLLADPAYFNLNFDTREANERALLSGASGGIDESARVALTPAAVVGITSNEIRETASELGMSAATLALDFQPGTDPEKYYPRDSVDETDVQGLFANMAERGVVPKKLIDDLIQNPQKYNIIVEAGRMDATKRKHILIEAMQHLPDNTILFITGKPDGKGVYKRLAERIRVLGLDNRVFLLGMVPDQHMGPLMSLPHGGDERQFRLAVVASASRMEGWGMAVQDGTSGGLPLVSSSYTPYAMHLYQTTKESRPDKPNEISAVKIVPVGVDNEPEEYANEIGELIANPSKARQMAKRALEIARQYRWSALTERFINQVNGQFFGSASVYLDVSQDVPSRHLIQHASPDIHVVVMAGGKGTGFRPYSSDEMPKQFLPVTENDRSMLQATAGRFLNAKGGEDNAISPENIWVSTNGRDAELVAEQLPQIPASNIIGEPIRRNTAPAIATLMHRIALRNPNAIAVIVPSDHYIASAKIFLEQVAEAAEFAASSGGLVTFGIPPTWPSPDYGYIERGERVDAKTSVSDGIYHVEQFVEKPTSEKLQSYIDRDNFLWNSGIFVWKVSDFMDHLATHQPIMHAGLNAVYGSIPNEEPLTAEVMGDYFGPLNPISIDHALMEPAAKEGNVYVLPFATDWSDVGTWQGLKRLVDEGRAAPPKRALEFMEQELKAN